MPHSFDSFFALYFKVDFAAVSFFYCIKSLFNDFTVFSSLTGSFLQIFTNTFSLTQIVNRDHLQICKFFGKLCSCPRCSRRHAGPRKGTPAGISLLLRLQRHPQGACLVMSRKLNAAIFYI
jgi:hypothetical protein